MAPKQDKTDEIRRDASSSPESISEASLSSSSNSTSSEEEDQERSSAQSPPSQTTPRPQPSLRDRLNTLLPQLERANDSLRHAPNSSDARFELGHEDSEEDEGYSSEAEDGPYIEMNLGLGVLEQTQSAENVGKILFPGSSGSETVLPHKRKASEDSENSRNDEHEKHSPEPKRAKIEVVDE